MVIDPIDPIAFIRRQHKAIIDNPTGPGVHVREREFQAGVFEKVGLLLDRIDLLKRVGLVALQTLNAWAEWEHDLLGDVPSTLTEVIQHARELDKRRTDAIALLTEALPHEAAPNPDRG